MQDDPTSNLPDGHGPTSNGAQNGNSLYVKDLHYHANDLTELRRLAEVDPALARAVIENEDRRHAREDKSFRLGMILSGVLATTILLTFVATIYLFGIAQSVGMIVLLMVVGHLLRVILTGEWSETSWLGRYLSGSTGKPPPNPDD